MRSSASAGLSGRGSAFTSAGMPAIFRRREERPSSSFRIALRLAGSETTDQRSLLASALSTSAVNTCVPSGRSLGAIVTGTSNSGEKFCRT